MSENHRIIKAERGLQDYLIQPTVMTPEKYPQVPHPDVSETLPDSTTSLGNLIQCLTTLAGDDIFLIPNLNLIAVLQFKAISSHPSTRDTAVETDPQLAPSSFQGVLGVRRSPLS